MARAALTLALLLGLPLTACGGDGPEDEQGFSSSGGGGGAARGAGGALGTGGGVAAGGSSSSGGTGGGGPTASRDCTARVDRESYDYDLRLPPSSSPPGGLAVDETPLFVAIGFDDNESPAGMTWAIEMLSERGVRGSFFHTTTYLDGVKSAWSAALTAGFEVGVHTHTHPHGGDFSEEEWQPELGTALGWLTDTPGGLGAPRAAVRGFRAPFLEYSAELFEVLPEVGLWYDCSIEEGFADDQDPSGYLWPYTLESGSPGHEVNRALGIPTRQFVLGQYPGVIELPVYALLVPDDSLASEYGFSEGLRERMASVPDFEAFGSKITGFDYNLWSQAGVSGDELVAILSYNLDQRLAGNRAPLLFGAHTGTYASDAERRAALEDFLDYALSKPEVRVVGFDDVVDFLREPMPLDCY